jgi:predicted esterase
MTLSVMYLHGLESGPYAGKATALRTAFEVVAPKLPTEGVIEARGTSEGALEHEMEKALQVAVDAYRACQPNVVVGSSFGGAVLLKLVHHPEWRAESSALFLAQAGMRLTPLRALPHNVRAVLVHGALDNVIPVEDSRVLAASSPHALFVEVQDDHRLSMTMKRGLLESLVHLAHAVRTIT